MTKSTIPQANHSSNHQSETPPKSEAGPLPESGRGPKGQFAKSNRGCPGNPFARQVAAMRQEFLKAVTSEDMAGIVRALIEKAKEGDVAAAKLVLQYTLGKPAGTVDPDRLDETEWQQWLREAVHNSEAHAVFKACAAETACVMARDIVPLMQKVIFEDCAATVQEREAARQKRETTSKQRETASKQRESASQGAGQRRERAEASPGAQKESVPMAPVTRKVSAFEAQKGEPSGQRMPEESREEVVNRVLRMLGAAVNKREETARRAAKKRR
jgi:hypothetical protein